MTMRVKRILCVVIATLLCFSLVGCKELDDLRAHHAVMLDDGTLRLNGEIYVPLPYCEEFTPPMGKGEMITITEPDVPVLLSQRFYLDYSTISEAGAIGENRIIGSVGQYYCLQEDYDALAARIEQGADMSGMRYLYANWDDEEGVWTEESVILTEEQVNAVKRVLATVEPYENEDVYYENVIELEWCSADGLFSTYAYDLCNYNGHYALIDWGKDTPIFYEAPVEYNAIFETIMQPYVEGKGSYYDEFWYE